MAKYYNVTELHCVAALLDPRQKNNETLMSADERSQAINSLKIMTANAVSVPSDSEPK